MASTSLDLSQIKTDALSAASTFRTLIGLGNVNNTSDANKPISSATQSALDGKLSLTGGTLTGAVASNLGTVTTSTPALSINQTWNNAAVNFSLINGSITPTAASGSYWFNFTSTSNWGGSGSAPFFRASARDGAIEISSMWGQGSLLLGNIAIRLEGQYGNGFYVKDYTGTEIAQINTEYGDTGIQAQRAAMPIGWSGLKLRRDAADTLALQRSTNAQRFNLYGTYTDGSNYRRLYVSSTTAGAFTIGVEGAGTGASGNTLTINNSLTVAGELFPQSLYVNSSNWFGVANRAIFSSPSDGVMKLTNWADNDFFRLQLGGTNSSFPAIKRNGTALNFRLADDSADAPITASAGTFSGNVTTSRVVFNAANNMYIRDNGSGLILSYYGGEIYRFGYGELSIDLSGQGSLRFGSQTTIQCQNGGLTVVQGGTSVSQVWRIANTYTDTSNFRVLNLSWSTYNAVNYARVGVVTAGTGISDCPLVLSPSGTGAFILGPMPDGTATGGNARGANAVDLQTLRSAASQVASGESSFVAGRANTASNFRSVAIGFGNSVSQTNGFAAGNSNTVSGGGVENGIALGAFNTASSGSAVTVGFANLASGSRAFATGDSTQSTAFCTSTFGHRSVADRYAMTAFSAGWFSANGDAQYARFIARNKTTDNTATTLFLDGSTTRLTIPSGKLFLFTAKIVGVRSDGLRRASYIRKGTIINVGGATSIVGAIEAVGTDVEDDPNLNLTITADDTNDALDIQVTGITGETWRWVAVVEGVEVAYGT